jgi:hypothetical protein
MSEIDLKLQGSKLRAAIKSNPRLRLEYMSMMLNLCRSYDIEITDECLQSLTVATHDEMNTTISVTILPATSVHGCS